MSWETDRDPRLVWADEGPRSGRFGDVYFSREDGLAESRAVFLAGCGLPDALAGRAAFVVAELGFGTGLNIAALLRLWNQTRTPGARLGVFSIEGFPLAREEARKALSAWPELAAETAALLDIWPPSTPGFHRIDLPDYGAVLDVAVGDAAWALTQWSGAADAWFLDGFSPALNPGMWSDAVLDGVAARSAPGARLATFTVAGAVRRGLTARGFKVEKRVGHGRKRERLEATAQSRPPSTHAAPPTEAVVIGAGIAGAATVRALAAQGVTARVLEPLHAGAGASGSPAALVTPRLDLGDAVIAALFAQALARAGPLYSAVDGAVIARGVLQLRHGPRDDGRFPRLADQPLWPTGAMQVLDAQAASALAGEPVSGSALRMADALTVRPQRILDAWLADAPRIAGAAHSLQQTAEGWRIMDDARKVVTESRAVFICAGWGAAALVPDAGLSPVRGQVDWVEGVTAPAMAWGGYAAPTHEGLVFGATHDRGETTTTLRPEDSARNLDTLAARLPELARRALAGGARRSRAAVRAVTRDRLPVAGPVGEGLYLLGGLGSRGFCLAPLLGEHLAALALGRPSPLPRSLADRLDPARFVPQPPPAARI